MDDSMTTTGNKLWVTKEARVWITFDITNDNGITYYN